jgi:peroxiredoxin
MVVQIGQPLPALAVLDENGQRVGIEELRAGQPAVLFFMRAHNCMMCMRHTRALAGMHGELTAHKVRPIVVVPGTAANAAAVRRKVDDVVRVVGSDDVTAHRAVELGRSLLMQHSGTFLVGGDGTVRYAKTAAMPTGSFDRAELLGELTRL